MFRAWCAACHAADGTGRVATPLVKTRPLDFTNCRLAAGEADADWRVVITGGGPAAGLSSEMPAFETLDESQVSRLVTHLRTMCAERGWPSGNLNFPRALFTTKAYPDSEITFQPVVSHSPDIRTRIRLDTVYEQRVGRRAHVEVHLPVEAFQWVTGPIGGVGDIAFGGSYTFYANSERPAIATAGFEVRLPTGNVYWRFGEGATRFEPSLTAATLWRGLYVQAELRAELPTHRVSIEEENRIAVYNVALSRDFSPTPTTWNVGVELNGENYAIAVTPQVRKGLTRSGALAGTFGVRLPITNLYHHKSGVVRWSLSLVWDYMEWKKRRH